MPTPDEQHKELRAGLISQLRYLTVEAEALEAIVGRVPEEILAGCPPGADLSIKEIFGLLAARDEQVHRPRLKRMTAGSEPVFGHADEEALVGAEDWNAMEMDALLARVQSTRQALIEALEGLPPEAWTRTAHFPIEDDNAEDEREERDVYEWVHTICLHDAERLRAMSHRLHDSDLAPPSPVTRRG